VDAHLGFLASSRRKKEKNRRGEEKRGGNRYRVGDLN